MSEFRYATFRNGATCCASNDGPEFPRCRHCVDAEVFDTRAATIETPNPYTVPIATEMARRLRARTPQELFEAAYQARRAEEFANDHHD